MLKTGGEIETKYIVCAPKECTEKEIDTRKQAISIACDGIHCKGEIMEF